MSDFFFVLLIIIILFGVFRRYIAFLLLSAISKKLNNKFQEMQNQQRTHQRPPVGQVHVDYDNSSKKSSSGRSDDEGEYVDFEEVK
jgi:hypothetical protein